VGERVLERPGDTSEHAKLKGIHTNGDTSMAEESQQQRSGPSEGQLPWSPGQTSQARRGRGGDQPGALSRRGASLPSMFTMEPSDMARLSPFALMRRLTEEMDHYFTQLGMERGGPGMAAVGSGVLSPPVEVVEREGALIVRVDLPGLTKDDVRVEVSEDSLTIEGERRSEHETEQAGLLHCERTYGRFRRQVPLPEGANAEQATANFKDGVLEISVPAPQRQARGRQIEIQSSAPSTAASQTSSEAGQEQAQTATTEGRA
jgi:HSP20 family protein